ncbi:MAG: XRE family transcriptional regulator [bacterium]|nr:XRE family transcriptional regulator [bacterium]
MKIGKRIKELRQASGLTQEELALRSNLTKGFISQVEHDLTSLSVDSLVQILAALDESPADFFREALQEKVVFGKDDRVKVEKRGVKRFELLVPAAQNREMEPAIVILSQGEKTPREDSHEGEEFGYVVEGKIAIRLGAKFFYAKEEDCFYFTANTVHYLQNAGRKTAVVVWVSSPPMF